MVHYSPSPPLQPFRGGPGVLRGREGLALVRAKGEEPGGGVGRAGGVGGVSASGEKREDAGVGGTNTPSK